MVLTIRLKSYQVHLMHHVTTLQQDYEHFYYARRQSNNQTDRQRGRQTDRELQISITLKQCPNIVNSNWCSPKTVFLDHYPSCATETQKTHNCFLGCKCWYNFVFLIKCLIFSLPCPTTVIHTYTKMNLSTVKWTQWDKSQSRELLVLLICVSIALCTIVAHNTSQNRPDNFPSYPADNRHCSNDVSLREGWGTESWCLASVHRARRQNSELTASSRWTITSRWALNTRHRRSSMSSDYEDRLRYWYLRVLYVSAKL